MQHLINLTAFSSELYLLAFGHHKDINDVNKPVLFWGLCSLNMTEIQKKFEIHCSKEHGNKKVFVKPKKVLCHQAAKPFLPLNGSFNNSSTVAASTFTK